MDGRSGVRRSVRIGEEEGDGPRGRGLDRPIRGHEAGRSEPRRQLRGSGGMGRRRRPVAKPDAGTAQRIVGGLLEGSFSRGVVTRGGGGRRGSGAGSGGAVATVRLAAQTGQEDAGEEQGDGTPRPLREVASCGLSCRERHAAPCVTESPRPPGPSDPPRAPRASRSGGRGRVRRSAPTSRTLFGAPKFHRGGVIRARTT